MKAFKKTLLYILTPILLFGLYIVGNLLYATLTDFQPESEIEIRQYGSASSTASDNSFTFMTWNIGYSGLGAEVDFFYDGGEMVHPPKDRNEAYMQGIMSTIANNLNTDFILLQEVDTLSARSYRVNQFRNIAQVLTEHTAAAALNYKVNFIPIPITNPLGKVNGGLATYSKFSADKVTRYQFPGNYSWPNRVFFLDRCFMVHRIPLAGKELIVINTHNSAYDDGTLKAQQMEYLKEFLINEYEQGNYVVVGGDWNQCPPGFDPHTFDSGNDGDYDQLNIADDYLPKSWQWVYDAEVPTNRKLAAPYQAGKTFTTLIDFYLISPNLKLLSVEGINLDFAYSDHQPVLMRVALK